MKNGVLYKFSLLSLVVLLPFLVVTGCRESKKVSGYKSVSMESGLEMMRIMERYVLLDVRRKDEYDKGHIPGAVLLTNELMEEREVTELLKNKEDLIFVYCRSGRRSKEASEKLSSWGYKNVIEIGGILDYDGEIER